MSNKPQTHLDNRMSEKDVFLFFNGIYGFEQHHQFGFINQTDDANNPFRLMVSLSNPDISFVVIPPTFIHDNYEIKIDDIELKELGIKDESDILVFCIVSLSHNNNSIYVNLKSPIVLSVSKKCGKQIILDNSPYEIRHIVELGN
jgi:flagellar assembly factor FliW